LDTLRANPLLEKVWIEEGGLKHYEFVTSSHPFKMERLKLLWILGHDASKVGALIDCLVSGISLPETAKLRISAYKGEIELKDVLPRVKHIATSFTRMCVVYNSGNIDLSGPKGRLSISPFSRSEIFSALAKEPLPSFGTIEDLSLVTLRVARFGPSEFPPFNPSLFPALKTLTILQDEWPRTTLSRLLSSPTQFSLDKLEIRGCKVSIRLKFDLMKFAHRSGRKFTGDWKNAPITIFRPGQSSDVTKHQPSRGSSTLTRAMTMATRIFPRLSSMMTSGSPWPGNIPDPRKFRVKGLLGPGPSEKEKTDIARSDV
jgi:hypothetical protein